MTDFDIFRVLDLGFLGEAWQGCFIKFHYLTIKDTRKFIDLPANEGKISPTVLNNILAVLKEKFVEGKALVKGQQVGLKAEDIDDMPVDVLNKALELLVGSGEKKEVKN